MEELMRYISESNNNADHRQARILHTYLVASLLRLTDTEEVRFYNAGGVCYRVAYFRYYSGGPVSAQ